MPTTLQKIWTRPALMIFSKSKPVASNEEANAGQWNIGQTAGSDYLYLTDDNRSDLQVSLQRIEYKKRMINGRMRAYHVADKKTFGVNWRDLPSDRSHISEVRFGGTLNAWGSSQEMLTWYKEHTNSFYLILVYDTPEAGNSVPINYSLEYYNVFFDDFSYTINKRGPQNDFWSISMTLVEV